MVAQCIRMNCFNVRIVIKYCPALPACGGGWAISADGALVFLDNVGITFMEITVKAGLAVGEHAP